MFHGNKDEISLAFKYMKSRYSEVIMSLFSIVSSLKGEEVTLLYSLRDGVYQKGGDQCEDYEGKMSGMMEQSL